MVEIRHVENLHDIIFFCWGWSDLDKISQTGAEWHVDCGDMAKLETRCRIPIWRTFGQITCQSHLPHCRVLPWANSTACHFRVKYHIAGWCYLVNSLSWFQSHMPHCWVQSPGEINVMIIPQIMGSFKSRCHTRSTASNLEQVANLLCAQANSAFYPQWDRKWVVTMATGWRPSVADWGDGVY